MTESEFLKIIDSFPDKIKLKKSTSEMLILEYCYMSYSGLSKMMRKDKLELTGLSEEQWWKLLSFYTIATEFDKGDLNLPKAEEILSYREIDIWQQVCISLNKFYCMPNVVKGIGGILLDELIEFAKNDEIIIISNHYLI